MSPVLDTILRKAHANFSGKKEKETWLGKGRHWVTGQVIMVLVTPGDLAITRVPTLKSVLFCLTLLSQATHSTGNECVLATHALPVRSLLFIVLHDHMILYPLHTIFGYVHS